MEIIGRYKEKNILQGYYESDTPEFIAVYGRRRIGKTYLIKEYFKDKFSFYITGLANATKEEQMEAFNASLDFYGKMPYPKVESWLEAFRQLIYLIEHTNKKAKKVIFIDELPWFDTPRSGFITALDFFWNTWASSRPDILLIVCGSATSWMINKLLKNKGGLHNRVTHRLPLAPFTLSECEEYFHHKKIVFDRKSIVELYMIFGGIPFYLNRMGKSLSVAQNVDKLCFAKDGELKDEFSILYSSLFRNYDNYVKVIETLSRKTKGLMREEIVESSKLQGGGLTKILEELEQCDFIRKYYPFGKKNKYAIYQLVDFFSLFYYNFMESNKSGKNFWTSMIDNAMHRAWSGYSFELVCLMHEEQIKRKLGISGVLTNSGSWRSLNAEPAAQIDLVIDRNDRIINLCEMKYANSEYVIDKKYDAELRRKKAAFIAETKTRKSVHLTMLTTYGVMHNGYWNTIQSEITMDDLFEK